MQWKLSFVFITAVTWLLIRISSCHSNTAITHELYFVADLQLMIPYTVKFMSTRLELQITNSKWNELYIPQIVHGPLWPLPSISGALWESTGLSLGQSQTYHMEKESVHTLIARFMWPTWGPSGADRTQVGPMLAPWTLLSEYVS